MPKRSRKAPVSAARPPHAAGRAWVWIAIGGVLLATALFALQWWASRPAVNKMPPGSTVATRAEFTGSAACATCHAQEHRAWNGSQHQQAMQHAAEATVLGNFNNARYRHGRVESTFFRRDGKYFVRTDGRDGALADFEIRYTFGVYPLQQYLVGFADGRLQALSIAWDSRPQAAGGQRWFHLYPNERIDHRDELHWTRRSQNWNFMCADCHSTNLRKNYDAASDTFKTAWSEISVGCESCHGPGSAHIGWAKQKGSDPAQGLTVAFDERRGVTWKIDPATGNARRSAANNTDREIEVCAPCHARRAQIAESHHAGQPFLDHYRPSLLAPGLYHPDGQQRGEVYTWGSFLQSKMHRAGVTCGDCHEPHGAKLRAEGNAVCAQCHLSAKYDAPSHHFHKTGAGTQCVECHMPATTYMEIDPRRDHSLRIPRPDLSVSLGVPNACTGCHAGKTAQWADDTVRKWYGHRPAGFQHFAATLAGGTGADLIGLAGDFSQPAIARASAFALLDRFPSEPGLDAIRSGLIDADPLVRGASIAALGPMPPEQRVPLVAPLLDDPLRAVRIEAASSLAGAPEAALNAAQRASLDRAATEFVAVQKYNADRPEARATLGGFFAQRGRFAEAEAEFRTAIAMEPASEPAYANYADLYRLQGKDDAAEALLAKGLKQMPQSATLHHARGLALVRLRRGPEAAAELKRAVQLAPDDARFAYVYAVALNSAGRQREALAEVDRGLGRHPGNLDLLNAGAAFAREAADAKAAERYAKQLGEAQHAR